MKNKMLIFKNYLNLTDKFFFRKKNLKKKQTMLDFSKACG